MAGSRETQAPRRPGAPAATRRALLAKAGVLLSLGFMTAGTALISADAEAEAPRAEAEAPQPETRIRTEPSALDVLDEAAATARTPETLAASPLSSRLAEVRAASRASARQALPEESSAGADGTVAAMVDEPEVIMPLAAGTYRNTSGYGYRQHPLGGGSGMHTGTDYSAPIGTPIHAIADGVVTHAGEGIEGRSSMLVIIEHEIDGALVESWYVHMYPEDVYVQTGQAVDAGDIIAGVGNNGYSTGPHLHFEIHQNGETVDPLPWLEAMEAVDVGEL
ncbi:M23 family metallopeptidase [Georgenia alba]|uniref:M23 family metallopeptidase n=1 Tax=Georgenia alba TaxID=2233858 RepID=A0ABW2Q815_9MICO